MVEHRLWERRRAIACAMALAPAVQVVPSTLQILTHPESRLEASAQHTHADEQTPHGVHWPGLSSIDVTEFPAPATVVHRHLVELVADTGAEVPVTIDRP